MWLECWCCGGDCLSWEPLFSAAMGAVTCALFRVPGSSRSLSVQLSRDVCLLVARLTHGRRSRLRSLAFCSIGFTVYSVFVPAVSRNVA